MMQNSMGRTVSEQMDYFTHSVEPPTLPAPPKASGEFLVRLGEGWGGSLHDLADGLSVWELGPAAAAGVLLSWCEFVAYEVEGREEGRGTMGRMQLLRGAVMAAGIEAVGAGRGGW